MIDWDAVVIGPNMGVFGEPIRYRTCPVPGQPAIAFTIVGIFDEPNVDQFLTDAMDPGVIVNTKPTLGVQLSQLLQLGVEPAQEDVLTRVLTGKCYQVSKVRLDGHGGATLALSNAFDTANPP